MDLVTSEGFFNSSSSQSYMENQAEDDRKIIGSRKSRHPVLKLDKQTRCSTWNPHVAEHGGPKLNEKTQQGIHRFPSRQPYGWVS